MANQEHLAILEQGVEIWNLWRKEHPDIQPDLTGANLNKAHLEKADLTEANLSETHLEEANLSFARLQRANLREAKLERANLWRSQLQDAYLREAQLGEANLFRAQMERTNLHGIILSSERQCIGPVIADIRWGDTNHAIANWSQVKILGDEYRARQKKNYNGKVKNRATRLGVCLQLEQKVGIGM